MEEIQDLDQFLQDNLTKTNYDNLPTKLEMTGNKLNRRLGKPENIDLELIKKIAEELEGISAFDLVEKFDAGIDKLTAREYKALKASK